ncbi:MAG: TrkA C-terminal domain-containing protein [Candidatus Omnitrophota bacterium]
MGLIFVIPVIVIIVASAVLVKIASVALNLTGLDEKRAFFQALSAFTGTGFTTRDSELVVRNDIRRKIIMFLMIMGNAGLVSVITTLMLSLFEGGGLTPLLVNITIILLAVLLLIKISLNKKLTVKLTKKIQARLMQSSSFAKRPVEEILRLAEGYGVAEVTLNEGNSDIGKSLFEASFRQKDILILAIERGTGVIPAPHANDRLLQNDMLVCYGKLENISRIGQGNTEDTDEE